MQTFFESIKIVDGIIYNLDLHISRMNRAIKMYYPNTNLIVTLPINIPIKYKKGLAALVDDEYDDIINNPRMTLISKDDISEKSLDIWFGKNSDLRKTELLK